MFLIECQERLSYRQLSWRGWCIMDPWSSMLASIMGMFLIVSQERGSVGQLSWGGWHIMVQYGSVHGVHASHSKSRKDECLATVMSWRCWCIMVQYA